MNHHARVNRRMGLWACTAILGLLVGFMPACTPLTLSIGPENRPPRETTVHKDKQAGRDKVAIIDLRGLITDSPSATIFGPGENPVDHIVTRLRRAEDDTNVKAVILRINSPGGTVTASDTLHDEVRRFRERSGKPVVASLGEVAASGGYYIAIAADEIITQPTTITASIGVVIQTMNVSDGLARIGIQSRAVTSGRNKDMANPLAPMRDGHYELLQGIVDQFYARFSSLVRERRPGIDAGAFADVTDGRVITGDEAARVGLADGLGGIHDAFARAKSLAGIEHASLIKYTSRGRAASTVYTRADAPPSATTPMNIEVNLLRLDTPWLTSPNAWYLWTPDLP